MYERLANTETPIDAGGDNPAEKQTVATSTEPNQEISKDISSTTGDIAQLPPDSKVDMPMYGSLTDLQSALSRFVRVASFTDDASADGYLIDPLRVWSLHPGIASKLNNYHGIRCTVHVRMDYNPNPLLVGQRVWAVNRIPAPSPGNSKLCANYRYNGAQYDVNTGVRSYFPEQLVQRPMKLYVSPWTTDTLEFNIPYAWNRDYYPIAKGSTGEYTPFTVESAWLEKVRTMDGSAIVRAPVYQIYVGVSDVQLYAFSTVQSSSENTYRSISGAVGKATQLANKFGISTTPIDAAKKLGDGVASYFGYSKPREKAESAILVRGNFDMIAHNGYSDHITLGDSTNDEYSVANPFVGGTRDDSFVSIGRIPGIVDSNGSNAGPLYRNFPYPSSATHGTVLWSKLVCKQNQRASGDTSPQFYTPGDWLMNQFVFWRADEVVYTFDIICNSFYKGSIVLCWDPYASIKPVVNTVVEVPSGVIMTKVVNISGPTRVEFRLPWMAMTPYLNTYASTANNAIEKPKYHMGCVYVLANTPLTCSFNATPQILIVPYKHYENLRLFVYAPDLMSDCAITPGYYAPNQGPILVDEQSAVGSTCFGEELKTVSQVLRTSYPITSVIQPPSTEPESRLAKLSGFQLMFPPAARPIHIITTNQGSAYSSNVCHPMNYFCSAFLARTGSVKDTVTIPGMAVAGTGSVMVDKGIWSGPDHLQWEATYGTYEHSDQVRLRELVKSDSGTIAPLLLKPWYFYYAAGWEYPLGYDDTHDATIKFLLTGMFKWRDEPVLHSEPDLTWGDFDLGVHAWHHFSAGESFGLFEFQNTPPIWYS